MVDAKRFEEFINQGTPSLEYREYDEHPPEKLLISYIYDQLETSRQARISAHVATCSLCHNKIRKLREERKEVESQLAWFLPDPLQMEIKGEGGEKETSFITRVKENLDSFLEKAIFPHRRAIYVHVGVYASVGGLLFGLNTLLDYLLVPPPSPLGSTAEVNRWWTYSYWLLLPWGFFLIGRIIYTLGAKRKSEIKESSNDESESIES